MKAESSVPTIEEVLHDRLIGVAKSVLGRIRDLKAKQGNVARIRNEYLPTVRSITSIEIADLDDEDGAFLLASNGRLTLNEEPIAKIIAAVIQDGKSRLRQKDVYLLESEIFSLIERAFVVYLLHELRHPSQGIGKKSDVSSTRRCGGSLAIAELDVQADRDAATVFSSIYYGNDPAEFLDGFAEALFMSINYFFPTFPVNEGRGDKLSRAFSIILMCARLACRSGRDTGTESHNLPLDAALFATVSSSGRDLAIYALEPQKRLLFVAENDDLVEEIASDVVKGKFLLGLANAISLLRRLGLCR